jgi:hypothetical protein
MVSKYSQLPETTKQKMREASRRWAAKNTRKQYYREYENSRPNAIASKMLRNSKTSAKTRGLEHLITIEDVVIPEKCPCCSQPMFSHSLDRINNDLGYVKGNVAVICWPCNSNKRQYNAEQHRMIADYIDRFTN